MFSISLRCIVTSFTRRFSDLFTVHVSIIVQKKHQKKRANFNIVNLLCVHGPLTEDVSSHTKSVLAKSRGQLTVDKFQFSFSLRSID